MKGYAENAIPGEKAICVNLEYTDKIEKLVITGDFFLHPEGCIVEMEKALEGVPLSMNDMELRDIITSVMDARNAELIGVSAKGIVAAIRSATARDL